MRRREFITLLGGATVWPLAARAQQPERVRQIGVFMRLSESDPVTKGYLTALSGGLAPLGWSENRNLQFEKRLTGGDDVATNTAAADLVRLNPDVILAHGTETSRIMQQHTRTIPLVFTTVTTRSAAGWLRVWRAPAATSLDSPTSNSRWPVNGSNCLRRLRPPSET